MTTLSEKEVSIINNNFWQDISDPRGEGLITQQQLFNKHASEVVSESMTYQSTQKSASMPNQSLFLTELREDGVSRRMLDYKPISAGQLDKDHVLPDTPVIYVPVEDRISKYLSETGDFLGTGADLFYRSKYVPVRFVTHYSPTIKMDKGQILSTKYPIRQYLDGLLKNDMLAREDAELVENYERCIYWVARQNEVSTIQSTNTGFLMEDIGDMAKIMAKRKLQLYGILVHEATFYDTVKWTQSQVGSNVMADIVQSGAVGPDSRFKAYAGYRWFITNNEDIVKEGDMYGVTTSEYQGRFMQLQQPQVYLKYERGMMEMYVDQMLGRQILNPRSVVKLKLA